MRIPAKIQSLRTPELEGADRGAGSQSHLARAVTLHLAGKREEALAQYRAVLARPNVYDSHDLAQKGLRQPFKMEVVMPTGEEGDGSGLRDED